MFKNLFSNIAGFLTNGSSFYIYIGVFVAGLALGIYPTYRLTSDHYETKIAKVNQEAFEHTTKVIEEQAAISQNTQKEKDELQNRYDTVVDMLRGMHKPGVSADSNSIAPIPSQGLRLLGSNAEFLFRFAKECSNTEIERNDVIQKYNALTVK